MSQRGFVGELAAGKNIKGQKASNRAINKKATLLRLTLYLMQYKWLLLVAFILTVGSNLLALIGPMLSGYAVDAIVGVGKVQFEKVFYYAAWMVAFYLVSSLLSYWLSILMITISKKVVKRMRKDVFDKLLKLPVGYFDTRQTGDIISRITYDIDTINGSLSSDLIQIVTTLITVTGALSMMLVISKSLVLVFCFTVPLSIGITKFITTKTRPLFRDRSAKLGLLNGFTEEMVSGQKTLKAYTQEENVLAKFRKKNEEAVDAYYRAEYYGAMTGPCVNFINNLSLSLISVFGAMLFLAGKMTIGNISSFILYSRKFSGPINEAANIVSELQSSLAAAERIFSLLDEMNEIEDGEQAIVLGSKEQVQGKVELSHVQFGYEEGRTIIHDLSLKVEPGKLIAIVGPTGAGKTTLINLLMRFYDIQSGNILVDDHPSKDLTRESLRKSFAMVLQETWLFHGTIYDNLAYGKEGATREEVIAAAKAVKIHSFIQRLPQGYDTVISDEGSNISKGQKQLLTIARAMLLEAPMLILDEATSNVDTRTELQIGQAMRKLMENKTCFVIAHRLSTIQNADTILVVKDGEVVEQGTHESLMEQRGFYCSLYEAQFA
ncbi:MAG: ABC transporter ATP-binding protein [Zhenhengia sp.]|jgi:ATP-binding cassette subfamily B multidrug efflux pump|uniref:ABC transporter ATP-binding protein n=1 Tax=Zhenhengia yiwuensis TaxID=2763666 RepID=A0A926EFX3_9FIRM|nr:ABC transporter ATP-binding protein [Zhenhengia yiwuensis]MBC8579589.1 ABC transporter ATP-binding protein [Zhenhengia yiwuensis]